MEVVAEEGDGAAGVEAVLEHRPDVVLMDFQMPGVGGVEATRRLVSEFADVKILVLTMVDDDQAVFAAIRAGALGYLLKGAGQDEISRALASVAEGGGVYGQGIARRLRSFLMAGAPAAPFPSLSTRERDVLTLVVGGASNTDIARRLFLSDKTVRNYICTLLTKLGVTTRAEAIVKAREAGLGDTDKSPSAPR